MKRRAFLKTGLQTAALSAAATFAAPAFVRLQNTNSKLNIAQVGMAGMQGKFHSDNIQGENVTAICDVNSTTLGKAGERYTGAKKFTDFRKLLDKCGSDLDGIVVSTPDHTHAAISIAAMQRGINCYTEKPLTHDIHELRAMVQLAKDKKLKTQMGTQIHATDNYRRVVEAVQGGVIGTITKVHVWAGASWGNKAKPSGDETIPADLDWDLWLGPALDTPYHKCYFGGNWRSFWAFGNGSLGDMGCHCMDLVFWALGLEHPTAIETINAPKDLSAECCPCDLTVKYDFPKTEKHEALSMYWYDGNAKPALLSEFGMPNWGSGVLFIGTKGVMYAHYNDLKIFGNIAEFQNYTAPPQTIPKSVGHHKEWLDAIKNDGQTLCNFDYGGKVAETVLLGSLSFRAGQKIAWNAQACKSDNDVVNDLIWQPRRKGWELENLNDGVRTHKLRW